MISDPRHPIIITGNAHIGPPLKSQNEGGFEQSHSRKQRSHRKEKHQTQSNSKNISSRMEHNWKKMLQLRKNIIIIEHQAVNVFR